MSKINIKQTEIGEIPEGWDTVLLKDVAVVNEKTIDKKYPHAEIEYVDIASVDKGRIFETKKLLRSEAPSRAQRIVRDNDILLSTVRPNLKHFAFMKMTNPNTIASTGFAVISSKTIDSRFLYYYLTTDRYTDYLSAIADAHTSAYPAFNPDILENSEIPFPPENEQRAIAKILSDLDAKIELNHQMNRTIESIAQVIFKRWFVDFEFPDAQGEPYKSNGGKMIESELGKIPKGWTISRLGDSGTFKNGINYLRDEAGDTDFFIANVRDIANNKLLLKESLDKIKINLSKAKEYLLQEKDILIARSASPGEISLVLGDLEKVIYSGFSIRYRLNDPNNYLYIFHIMQGLKRNLQNYSIGTTLQSVNQETLKNMKFILPSDETLKEFNKISKHILDKTLNNLLQNRELLQIRDSLLPRLISGRIRVG
jgi:type I restriction enzyme S subunit